MRFFSSACFSYLSHSTALCRSFVLFPDVKAKFVKLHPGHRVACVAFVVRSLFQTCAVGGSPSPSPNLKSTAQPSGVNLKEGGVGHNARLDTMWNDKKETE